MNISRQGRGKLSPWDSNCGLWKDISEGKSAKVVRVEFYTLSKCILLLLKNREEAKAWGGEKLWIEESRRGTTKVFFFDPKFGPSLPNDNFPRLIERACAADGKILLLYFWPHSLSSSPEKRSGNDAVCYPENRPSFEVADADLSFKSIPFLPSRSNRWSTAHSCNL